MDFLDPKKKQIHRQRLIAGYILIGIAIALTTFILALESYGFDYNRQSGTVIQNGIVFVGAQPAGADIYLNGVAQGRTDARLVVPSGQYTLELRQKGYSSWKRTFGLEGGSVNRYVYPFLFPQTLVTHDAQLYGSVPAFSTTSLDRHWLLASQPGSLVNFDEFDLTDTKKPIVTITIPAALFSVQKGDQQIKEVEWSNDNRHVLLEHTWQGGHEFIVFDRESPSQSVNLNQLFPAVPAKVTLRNQQYDQYYFYNPDDKTLARTTLKDKVVTPVLSDVLAFKTHGNSLVLYVTTKDAPANTAWVNVLDGTENYNLRKLPLDTSYLLNITQFNGDWYSAMGAASEGKVYIDKNAEAIVKHSSTALVVPVSILKVPQANYVSFSDNARFIMAEANNEFGVYDAETDKYYRYAMDAPFDAGQLHAKWMDGHRLTYISGGKVNVFDYDGINQHLLAASSASHPAYFDHDYTALYTFGPSVDVQGHFALLRTDLKVK